MGSQGGILQTQAGPRRVWMLVLFIIAAVPIVFTLRLPLTVSPYTHDFFNHITALSPGDVIFFGNTFEVPPVDSRDLWRSLFYSMAERDLKVVLLNYKEGGQASMEYLITYSNVEERFDWRYGEDWVMMPFLAGEESAMAASAEDLFSAFSTDAYDTPLSAIPVMSDIKGMDDADLAICQYGIFTFGDQFARQWGANYPTVPLLVIGQYYGIAAYYGTSVFGNIDNTVVAFAEYEFLVGYPGEELIKTEAINTQGYFTLASIIGGVILIRTVWKEE
jgi:hypothetical protein